MNEFSILIKDKQRRSNVMKSARIRPFFTKYIIRLGCDDGFRVCSRVITEKN